MEDIKAHIISRRDEIVAERKLLIEQRLELISRLRFLDKSLADCKAAARFLDLEIDFPLDEREEFERHRLLREQALLERSQRGANVHGLPPSEQISVIDSRATEALQFHAASVIYGEAASAANEAIRSPSAGNKRLSAKDAVLEFLTNAPSGAKAAEIRDFLERSHSLLLHEKTVGMTLYRLSQEGRVRRDRFNWFLVPPSAETKNPGGRTPGPETSFNGD